jgi:hypothetical protein
MKNSTSRLIGALLLACSINAQQSGSHYAVAVQGKAELLREGRTSYVPLQFGTLVGDKDLLKFAENSRATIVCADLTVRLAGQPSIGGVTCPKTAPFLTWKGDLINVTRASLRSDSFPAIISPRRTRLLNAHPMIRWGEVAGAAAYDITMEPDTGWRTRVEHRSELKYPNTAPALRAKTPYIFHVEVAAPASLARINSDEAGPDLGFSLLSPDDAKRVTQIEQEIRNLEVADAAKHLLITNLYLSNGLRAEAMEILRNIPRFANTLHMLGDVYRETGLLELAERQYLDALSATEDNDLDTKGAILESLGLVYLSKGGYSEARKEFGEAAAIYDRLGDRAARKRLDVSLSSLPRE